MSGNTCSLDIHFVLAENEVTEVKNTAEFDLAI